MLRCVVTALALVLLMGRGGHSTSSFNVDEYNSPWDLLYTPGYGHPSPREGHSATLIGTTVYVFGGYYATQATWGRGRTPAVLYDQLYSLNMIDLSWAQLSGTPPSTSSRDVVTQKAHQGIPVAIPAPVTEEDISQQRSFKVPLHAKNDIQIQPRDSIQGPSGRAEHTAANVNGVLYVFGGLVAPGNVATNELWRYVPTLHTWTLVTTEAGPSPRAGAVSWSEGNYFYIFGGYDPSTSVALSDTWKYDASSRVWLLLNTPNDLPGPRAFGNAAETSRGVLVYSGQDTAPYAPSHLSTGFSLFTASNWSSVLNVKKYPLFPLPATRGMAASFPEGAAVFFAGYGGPWARQINRCGWYNPDENNFIGYDPVGDVRVFNMQQRTWERGWDAPFWENKNVTARLANAAAVHFGNNVVFFGGCGCEDTALNGVTPFAAVYGQFNQLPVYNLYTDSRTSFNTGSMGVVVSHFLLLAALLFSIFA